MHRRWSPIVAIKFVSWNGTDRLVIEEPPLLEEFTLNAGVISIGLVSVTEDIHRPEDVRVFVESFGELRNESINTFPNFRVVGKDIVFMDSGLIGLAPPVGLKMSVYYHKLEVEDTLRENPEIKISANYEASTDTLRIGAWLHENGQVVEPLKCNFHISDFGTAKFSLSNVLPDAEGVCYATNIGTTLAPSGVYTVKVEVYTPTKTYRQIVPLEIKAEGTSTGDIAQAVWDVNRDDANVADTMGRLLNEMHIASVNMYVIDFATNQLIIYHKDKTTPAFVYDLKDKNNKASTTNVFARIPV